MKRIYMLALALIIALMFFNVGTQVSAQTTAEVTFGRGEIKKFTTTADKKTLAINSSLGVWLYDPNDMAAKPKLVPSAKTVFTSSFSSDGKLIALAIQTGEFPIVEVETGKVVGTFKEDNEYYVTRSVAISPDGKTVAAGCSDQKIRLFDIESGDLVTLEGGHKDDVTALLFSADGKTLVSAGDDKLIVVWDLEKEEARFTLKGHTGTIQEIALSADGKMLASVGYDKSVRVWDLTKGKQSAELTSTDVSEGYSVAFSPDGKTLAVGTGYPYVVRLWDLAKNKKTADLKGHRSYVRGVAFSPDGKTIISASSDSDLRTWDVAGANEKDAFTGIHAGAISDFEVSPDGKSIAVISAYERLVRVYAADKADAPAMILEGGDGEITSIAFSSDGKLIAGGSSNAIYVWDAEKGKLKTTVKLTSTLVQTVAFSADSKLIGWGSYDGKAGIHDAGTGKAVQAFNGHTLRVRNVQFSKDGTFFWTSSDDGTVRQWKIGK